MSKLTKVQAKAHAEACRILEKPKLSEDDKFFVLDNWQESASHINSVAGAFFTPTGLARDFAIEASGRRVIDLCAGIGSLAFATMDHNYANGPLDFVCVEINPDYAAIGQKILPEARWIVGDVFSLPGDIGRFDCAISNSPFGATPHALRAPRYAGRSFEYHVIDIASDLAAYGAFIIPQGSAPFKYSGQRHYEATTPSEYIKFAEATGIELTPNCGIDCSVYRGDWRGVAPAVEIVCADFTEVQAKRSAKRTDDLGLFAMLEAAE